MILASMREIIRYHPYLLPALGVLLAFLALAYIWRSLKEAGNCPECLEGKGLCLVACERVSRRLDEVDREVDQVESNEIKHPCRGCKAHYYGCENLCTSLTRWELGHM